MEWFKRAAKLAKLAGINPAHPQVSAMLLDAYKRGVDAETAVDEVARAFAEERK